MFFPSNISLFQRLCIGLFCCLGIACSEQEDYLLEAIPSSYTGIHFQNTITETSDFNILNFHYIYNGGGVGIGDFNKDGLQDVIFTGNQVASKLYLNQGNFQFKDISETANFLTEGWATGVSVVDINGDGWLDIYISVGGLDCSKGCKNQLFIHQGLENGIPIFEEAAAQYGLSDEGYYTQQAAFFDFDQDGDLDVYLLHNVIDKRDKNAPSPKRYISPLSEDKFLRNESEKFVDISEAMGIFHRGYGLGITINDFNRDGRADIYLANDFLSDDLLYLNRGLQKGKHLGFEEVSQQCLKHQSYNSMGVDVADLNNDALPEIMVLDMLPNYQERQKSMQGFMNYNKFLLMQQENYAAQFVRNTLQTHNGFLADSMLAFSEVAYYAGVYQTDWSWTPLLADFNNDGSRDLFVSNGYGKDITDLDFINYSQESNAFGSAADVQKRLFAAVQEMESVTMPNYIFQNQGDLHFRDCSGEWMKKVNSISNGAAYADLDNDGDLDVVVNNIDAEAFMLRNNSKPWNYINIQLKDTTKNNNAIGSQITIWHGGRQQTQYLSPVRGYLSSMQTPIHFGLSVDTWVDSLQIHWASGHVEMHYNLEANQTLNFSNAKKKKIAIATQHNSPIFQDITSETIDFQHKENPYIDFNTQRLLLRQYARQGPCIVAANVDAKAGDEIFIGGAKEQVSRILFEQTNGTYREQELTDTTTEASNALFLDIDGDEDLDLYLVNGSSEWRAGDAHYQDLFYLNDGKGSFTAQLDVLPDMKTSGAKAVALDFDQDGDEDIFVAARLSPHRYPEIPRSYLLENINGKFQDATPEALQHIGMLSDVLAIDIDGDTWKDLVIVGEWMPLTFALNKKGNFQVNQKANTAGLWNCIKAGDFDKDGDLDLIVGNIGLNTRLTASPDEPLRLYTEDLDNNNSPDPLIGKFNSNKQGNRKNYALHARDDVMQQLPMLKNRFIKYSEFGQADFETLLAHPLNEENSLVVHELASMYFQNDGKGNFEAEVLPIPCQWSLIQDILVHDFNEDGYLDALLVGNDYSAESNGGWQDASTGIFLVGNGTGNFQAKSSAESGFYAAGDNRAISLVQNNKQQLRVWVGRNNDKIQVFSY